MIKLAFAGGVVALTLAGCASGIQPEGQYPEVEFSVSATHDAVYRRAADYVRVCHENSQRLVGVKFASTRVLDTKGNRAEIRVHRSTRPRDILEVIVVTPHGMGDAMVHAKVLGQDEWDQAELQALRASIQSATPACRLSPSGT